MKVKLFFFVLVAIVMSACSDNMILTEPLENTVLARSNEQTSVNNYTVTPEMVCKYINLVHKGRGVNELSPIVQNGDTLAYLAQYADSLGWELISGDRRLDPILAYAENGILNLNDSINPGIVALNGMIQMVKDKKESTDTLKHQIWKVFEPASQNHNAIMPIYDGVSGMWVVEDTIIEEENIEVPHLIATKWGQGDPWFNYTPYINGVHGKVGCLAVAVAQYIYYYRCNNNRNITLPTIVSFSNTTNSYPTFLEYSTTGWEGMANTSLDLGTDIAAKFLSYVGSQLNINYDVNSSGGYASYIPSTLDYYKIGRTESSTYDFFDVIESLDNNNPILVCASSSEVGHAFIIDGYKKNISRNYVSYIWDPDYKVTEDDLRYAEPWRFQEPTSGKGYKEVDLCASGGTRIRMNWGWNGSNDNTYYTASTYLLIGNDEVYSEVAYSPSWTAGGYTYNNIGFMAYSAYELSE